MESGLPRVRKRDGRVEEYIPEKLVVSLIKNGLSPSAARAIENEIRGEIADKHTVSSIELAYHALSRVRKQGETLYQSWIYYDINHKRRRTDYEIKHILDKDIEP
ncbi:MAG: ATPase [Desulfurococcales archaeon]|nr:ATPase [Desulfurococcales archaeon]